MSRLALYRKSSRVILMLLETFLFDGVADFAEKKRRKHLMREQEPKDQPLSVSKHPRELIAHQRMDRAVFLKQLRACENGSEAERQQLLATMDAIVWAAGPLSERLAALGGRLSLELR